MRTTENNKTKRARDVISGLRRELALKKILYHGLKKDYFDRLNSEAQLEIQKFNYQLSRLDVLEKMLEDIPEDAEPKNDQKKIFR
jgi:hypothetical protein